MENALLPGYYRTRSHEAGLELRRIDDTVKKQYASPQRSSLAKDGLPNCSKYVTICLGLCGIIRGKRRRLGKRRNVGGPRASIEIEIAREEIRYSKIDNF